MASVTETTIDSLNTLLRGELSAVETYRQAEQKFQGESERNSLCRIRDEHQHAVGLLRQHVQERGGEPARSSGAWGTFAGLVEGTAKLFGRTAALKALKEGEESGIDDYESALDNPELPLECRLMISDHLLPRCREHVGQLDRLMDEQG